MQKEAQVLLMSTAEKVIEVHQAEIFEQDVQIPEEKQCHIPNVIVAHRFADGPQVEFADGIVEMPGEKPMQAPMVTKRRKFVEAPHDEITVKVVEVPVNKFVPVTLSEGEQHELRAAMDSNVLLRKPFDELDVKVLGNDWRIAAAGMRGRRPLTGRRPATGGEPMMSGAKRPGPGGPKEVRSMGVRRSSQTRDRHAEHEMPARCGSLWTATRHWGRAYDHWGQVS